MKKTTPETENGFSHLGLHPKLMIALEALGYEEPTPIQREAIPPLLEGRDLFGQAATGTGKTAAFALPLIQRFAEGIRTGAPMALVLVPTRELAMQVAEAMSRYGRNAGVKVLPIYGGQAIGVQLRALNNGVDVVVATPGRAIDHIGRGTLSLVGIEMVVLDEADEMLDMGFAEDIESILDATPPERQTILFSATMPPRIAGLTKRHLRDPVKIEISRDKGAMGAAPLVRQVGYLVSRAHKMAVLSRVLDIESPTAAIIFCRTRTEVDELTFAMGARGYRVDALHGGMTQEQRDKVMKRLRAGNSELLIATDVAARGLDIEQLSHVINYDVPPAAESYVHRIGRVGRAGREGVAITLFETREHRLIGNIERLTRQRIEILKIPTVADLFARQMEMTRASLREVLLEGKADQFRVIVESLADEFDVVQVAMAAVKLAHDATVGEKEGTDIPEPITRSERPSRFPPQPPERRSRDRGPSAGDDREPRGRRGGGTTRLYIGAGRATGIRPKDLVGAIANESGVPGNHILGIEIDERFSIVDVAAESADTIIGAMRGATLKGKKVNVRKFVEK